MKVFLRTFALVGLVVGRATPAFGGASTNAAWSAAEVARRGRETFEKLHHSPASWTVRCRLAAAEPVQIKVIRNGADGCWVFEAIQKDRSETLGRLVQRDGIWHLQEKIWAVRCQPYEAEFHLPGGYRLLGLSDLQCLAGPNELPGAQVEGRDGDEVLLRLPLTPDAREREQSLVSEIEAQCAKDHF